VFLLAVCFAAFKKKKVVIIHAKLEYFHSILYALLTQVLKRTHYDESCPSVCLSVCMSRLQSHLINSMKFWFCGLHLENVQQI
jgi:hypothetical protein